MNTELYCLVCFLYVIFVFCAFFIFSLRWDFDSFSRSIDAKIGKKSKDYDDMERKIESNDRNLWATLSRLADRVEALENQHKNTPTKKYTFRKSNKKPKHDRWTMLYKDLNI